jgi:hypothetical protein
MKKIFLLSLLSVLFLSAFSQLLPGTPEIITTISITKSIPDDEIDHLQCFSWNILRMFFYRDVKLEPTGNGGYNVYCSGFGTRMCSSIFYEFLIRGVAPEIVGNICDRIIGESEECIANGEYKGTISRKIASQDNQSIFVFTIHWDNDPTKPYNGKAEIIISKFDI